MTTNLPSVSIPYEDYRPFRLGVEVVQPQICVFVSIPYEDCRLFRLRKVAEIPPSRVVGFNPLRGLSAFSTRPHPQRRGDLRQVSIPYEDCRLFRQGHVGRDVGSPATCFNPLRGLSAFSTGRRDQRHFGGVQVSIPYEDCRPFRLEETPAKYGLEYQVSIPYEDCRPFRLAEFLWELSPVGLVSIPYEDCRPFRQPISKIPFSCPLRRAICTPPSISGSTQPILHPETEESPV